MSEEAARETASIAVEQAIAAVMYALANNERWSSASESELRAEAKKILTEIESWQR